MSSSDEINDGPELQLSNVFVLQTVQKSSYISIQDIKGEPVRLRNETYRHKVTASLYKVLAIGLMQIEGPFDLAPAVIYQSMSDKTIWIRPVTEFRKRFEIVEKKNS